MVKEIYSSVNYPIVELKEDSNPPPELSLEDMLLVQLSRSFLVPEVLKTVKGITQGNVDWDVFLEEAWRHNLIGLIHYHYSTHKLDLPSQVVMNLSRSAKTNQAQAMFLFYEIDKISEALSDTDIPVVVLKGPALTHQVYGLSSVRPFNDIDLLTFSECVPQVEKCLYELGYVHIKRDPRTIKIKPMTPSELNEAIICKHRPPMQRLTNSFSAISPKIDLHYSDAMIGDTEYDRIINSSIMHPKFSPGLRVLSLSDLIILSTEHFYNHYRIHSLAMLPSQTGVLKFLADIYACLKVYFRSGGDWPALLRRGTDTCAMEFLAYGLFYVNFFFGKGTIPEKVMSDLLNQKKVRAPLPGGISIPVASIDELLKSEIRTAASTYSPALWMFRPEKMPEILINDRKKWQSKGNKSPTIFCHRLNDALTNNFPGYDAWRLSEEVSIDQDNIDPNQFFLTHVSYGAWPVQGGIRAGIRSLWDKYNLFLGIKVFTENIPETPRDPIRTGYHCERVVLYISPPRNKEKPIHIYRISIAMGSKGHILSFQRAIQGEEYTDISLDPLHSALYVSGNDGYQINIKVPWNTLDILPYDGLRLGFDTEVVHLSSSQLLETVIVWSGGLNLSEKHPEFHGILILKD